MGVRGLLKFLRTTPNARDRNKSLAGLAEEKRQKTRQKPTIVLDFLGVLFWLLRSFHVAKVTLGEYKPESYIFGGDYTEYSSRFISLIKALRHVCAEPILFIDASRGSVLEDMNVKMLTLEDREREQMEFVEKCVKYCKYDGTLDPEDVKQWKKYPFIIVHILMALRSENVKIVYCPSEADSEMAEYARVHPEVCGILTTDTDMVMMRKCTIIHCKFFDRDDTLGITKPSFNEKPDDIICDLITPSSLARALKIQVEDLKILSIICGNDYTASFKLHRKMELGYPFISSAAEWLAENPTIPSISRKFFRIPVFAELLCTDSGANFFIAVKHTYEAYGDSDIFEEMCRVCGQSQRSIPQHPKVPLEPLSVSPLLDIVQRGIEKGEVTSRLSSVVKCGILWRSYFVEGQPSGTCSFQGIYDLLVCLRRVMYSLLGLRKVREFGHFTANPNPVAWEDFTMESDNSAFLRRIRDMAELSRGLHLVPLVVNATSCQQIDSVQCAPMPHDYLPHMTSQIKPLLICTTLLHALSLKDESNTFSNIELTTNVFLATCLMSAFEKPAFKVLERPTIEAMSMTNGFACVIHQIYDIASLFGLLHLLPPPGYLYQPGALVAFHAVAALNEDTVRTKLTRSRDFVEIHTTYTHLVQLRHFQIIKEVIVEFQQKCLEGQLQAMDAVRVAQAFYNVLGEYHSGVPELEERIEVLQSQVITEAQQQAKGSGKQKTPKRKKQAKPKPAEIPKKKKKKPKPIPESVREDMRAIESDLKQLST